MHNNKKTFNIRFKLVSKSLLAGFDYAYFIKIELAKKSNVIFYLTNIMDDTQYILKQHFTCRISLIKHTCDKFFGKKYSVQKINLKLRYI